MGKHKKVDESKGLHIAFCNTERMRFMKGLDNYGHLAKRKALKLKRKLHLNDNDGFFFLDEGDIDILFRIACYAGSLKVPKIRLKRRALNAERRAKQKRAA